jgi:Flp pilus assembly protein TadD
MNPDRPLPRRQFQGDLPAATVGGPKTPPRVGWVALLAGLLAALLVVAAPARADEYTEVNRLSRNGQLQQALTRAEAHLASKPRDPQMRFMRAGILAELDRKDEAEKMLVALTQDYPELPEPYNNLAVLLAARNELEQARAALEMALRNDSAYATAHENLGDVLAQLRQLAQKPPQP